MKTSKKNSIGFKVDEFQLKEAKKRFDFSVKRNTRLNEEHRKTLNTYYDKILFYSAGTFTLTVGLVGLMIDKYSKILFITSFIVPNIYWLYISWTFFLGACITALLVKKYDAFFIGNFGLVDQNKMEAEFLEKEMDFFEKYPESYYFKNVPFKKFKDLQTREICTLKNHEKQSLKREKKYYSVLRVFQTFAESFAIAGAICLFIFAVRTTLTIY